MEYAALAPVVMSKSSHTPHRVVVQFYKLSQPKKSPPFQYRKQDRYSSITVSDQRCLTVADTVIPGNIPYQDLVFSTEPAIHRNRLDDPVPVHLPILSQHPNSGAA